MSPHSQNPLGIGSIDNCRRGYKVNTERPGKMKSANRELGVGDLIKKDVNGMIGTVPESSSLRSKQGMRNGGTRRALNLLGQPINRVLYW